MRHALFRAAGDTVKALRRAGCRTPLIVLSEEKHRAECIDILDAGADDFVLGEVDGAELSARIRATLRKTRWARDMESGSPTNLTYREAVVFRMLARRAGGPVSKADMEKALFGGKVLQSNIIQTVIYGLRCKLGADNILTNRHIGYQLSSAFLRHEHRRDAHTPDRPVNSGKIDFTPGGQSPGAGFIRTLPVSETRVG
jgi:DNA-binding response OmpR family regulator